MAMLEHAQPEEAAFLPERVALLDERVGDWVERGLSPATSVLVARHGKIVLHKAYGQFSDEPDSRPLAIDDIFILASLQKVFTATAVMMCVERGVIDLNLPITHYLPEVPAEWGDRILVHYLLTHTSGYFEPDQQDLTAMMQGQVEVPPCPSGQAEFFHRYFTVAFRTKPIKKPSTQNIYSNINFNFLAEILRRASGQRIDEFMYEHILGPLGMTSSFIPPADAPESRLMLRRSIEINERVREGGW